VNAFKIINNSIINLEHLVRATYDPELQVCHLYFVQGDHKSLSKEEGAARVWELLCASSEMWHDSEQTPTFTSASDPDSGWSGVGKNADDDEDVKVWNSSL